MISRHVYHVTVGIIAVKLQLTKGFCYLYLNNYFCLHIGCEDFSQIPLFAGDLIRKSSLLKPLVVKKSVQFILDDEERVSHRGILKMLTTGVKCYVFCHFGLSDYHMIV